MLTKYHPQTCFSQLSPNPPSSNPWIRGRISPGSLSLQEETMRWSPCEEKSHRTPFLEFKNKTWALEHRRIVNAGCCWVSASFASKFCAQKCLKSNSGTRPVLLRSQSWIAMPVFLFCREEDKAMVQESGLLIYWRMAPSALQLQLRLLHACGHSCRLSPIRGLVTRTVFH